MRPAQAQLNGIAMLLLSVLCYGYFFVLPEARGVLIYDEARQAVSAFEMATNGNPFVTTFDGLPEMWSTKPPLFIWLVALSFKLFGFHIWALRLPSALAATALVLWLYRWLYKHSGNMPAAFITSLILLTAPGFIGDHGARTADFDAVLTLLIFGYSSLFYNYIQNQQANTLLWCALLFTLAFLTKSIAAAFALPGLVIYTLYNKQIVGLLKQWQLYAGVALFAACALGYYYLREQYNPGYLKAVQANEWSGRFNTPQEDNSGPWYYYFTQLGDWRQFSPMYYLLLPLTIASLLSKGAIRHMAIFSLILWVSILIVLSTAATKLPHYSLPAYPFLAISCGIGCVEIYNRTNHKWTPVLWALPIYLCISATVFTYGFISTHFTNTDEYGHVLNAVKEKTPAVKRIKTFEKSYQPGLIFNKQLYSTKGLTVINNGEAGPAVGDTVATCDAGQIQFIEERFTYTPITSSAYCKALIITGLK